MNQFNCTGNLGDDPKVFVFDNEDKKVSFSVAISDNYKDKANNWIDRVQWANWEATGNQAEKILAWKKGWQVLLTGKMQNVSYNHEGQTKYKTVYHVSKSELVSKKEIEQEKNRY